MCQSVVRKLADIQSLERLFDREMAERLGVPRETWQKVRTGQRPVNPRLARGIIRAYPHLMPEAVAALLEDGNESAGQCSQGAA